MPKAAPKRAATPAALAKLLVPVTDPAWRAWLERLLRKGERAQGGRSPAPAGERGAPR